MGSCTAGGAYVPAMSDESIIVRNQGTIFLGGPPLVKAATGEVVTAEELGGADVHSRQSGVTDHYAQNDAHAIGIARRIVATLKKPAPAVLNMREAREPAFAAEEIYGVVSADGRKPFDVHDIIARIVDGSELQPFLWNTIQFIWRNIIAKHVTSVIGEPQFFSGRMPVKPDRITNAAGKDLDITAIGFHAQNGGIRLFTFANVTWRANRDIQQTVRPKGNKLPTMPAIIGQLLIDNDWLRRVF